MKKLFTTLLIRLGLAHSTGHRACQKAHEAWRSQFEGERQVRAAIGGPRRRLS